MAANDVPCCETMFWVYLVISAALVAFAGLMSGLTLGLMSLSLVDLEVLIKAGQPEDQKNAAKILPIVKNQHLLLCTLLICNALAMEALPIFLDALLPAWGAILISVTLILAFGEIIPQAVCSRYGLSIGAKLSPLVRLLVIVFLPLSYPISKLLDLLLGKGHSALLRRAELKTLVDLHGNEAGKGGELTHNETTIITGALDLTQKTAKDAMTPLSRVFSLDLNSKLDDDLMDLLIRKGHSRVPVHSGCRANIVGLILVKNLIKCRPEDEASIKNLTIRRIPRVLDSIPLYDLLNQFQKGHSHMAVVVKRKDCNNVTPDAKAKVEIFRARMNSYSPERQTCQKGKHIYEAMVECNQSLKMLSLEKAITQSDSPKEKITSDGFEAFPNEEVIGIITMENVLEQLLQEPIFDETDGYVDVHDKIKINMLPGVKFLSRSPRVGSPSKSNWRSPVASPLSSSHQRTISYHHTPLLHSPISPCTPSPCVRPTLYTSPGNLIVNSPAKYARSLHSSPLADQVPSALRI